MRRLFQDLLKLPALIASLGSDRRGNVAIMFAFASVAVAVGVGAGLDISAAYGARQRLSQAATLACQYSTRTSVVNSQSSNQAYQDYPTNTFLAYLADVNAFATKSLTAQNVKAANVTGPSGGPYFTATTTASGPTGGVTEMSMSYQTKFLKILNVNSVPVHTRINCQNVPPSTQGASGTYVLQEGFENTSCVSYCYTLPSGQPGALLNPTSTFGTTPTYTGSGGFSFYVIGYCLEVDKTGIINSTSPEGNFTAELDCDNSNHTAGNSSISTRVYLKLGTYELRYFYRSRVDYPHYDPTYICGSTAADVAWANDTYTPTGPSTSSLRTNQVNVYLDQTTATAYPPLHYTAFGLTTEQLAGTNVIDECVYSPTWIERSVKITVTTAGYYWLSFAADGANDSFGAQLDNIRLCNVTCPGTLQANLPSWNVAQTTPSTVFEDTFDATVSSSWINAAGAAAAAQVDKVIPLTTVPLTNARYMQGTQYILPDGCNSGCGSSTRSFTVPFLLDPGYYQLSYYYVSLIDLTGSAANTLPACITPGSSQFATAYTTATTTTKNVKNLQMNTSKSTVYDNPLIGVFMANGSQVASPSVGTGFTTTNPLIDACFYYNQGSGTSGIQRTLTIKIPKPGYYYLTYYTAGSGSGPYTGAIDDVKLTAIADPSVAQTPDATIPVPNPQPDTSASFTGFSIIVDPFDPSGVGS